MQILLIPEIEHIKTSEQESFYGGHYRSKWFDRTWHFHPEYELILIRKGFGTRVVGNVQSSFTPNDLVLLGSNIPHAWFSDSSFFSEKNTAICESVYVQFGRDLFGNYFSNLPEMKQVNTLLNQAAFGLHFKNDSNPKLIDGILNLTQTKGLDRLLKLIKVLESFHKGSYSEILSRDYKTEHNLFPSKRIEQVYKFILNNYKNEIRVKDVAENVRMNQSSFCRYFKNKTGKTFTEYLNEIRIDFAQQLLINTNLLAKEIAYECGYTSVAYFNQCFKRISKMSPLEYRSRFKVV